MSTRVVEQVDDWDQQSFGGGYRELHALADDDFSGVVRADGAELFMTRGTVVGVRRGSIDAFEGASGTTYEAPTDALPLLAVMQERSDEVRAKYYTEDTAISEVDRTLEDGSFTGYVELSENVLSGDYYLVYHKGHSMAVAYVGSAGRLLTDDEAFERADGEVGIYEVRPVDIDPIEIPEPTEPVEEEPDDAAAVAGDAPDAEPDQSDGADADDPEPADASQSETDPPDAVDSDQQPSPSAGANADPIADESTGGLDGETVGDREGEDGTTDPAQTARAESDQPGDGAGTTDADTDDTTASPSAEPEEERDSEPPAEPTGAGSDGASASADRGTAESESPTEDADDGESRDATRRDGRDRSADESDAQPESEPGAVEAGSRSSETGDARQRREPASEERDTGGASAGANERTGTESVGSAGAAASSTSSSAGSSNSDSATAGQSPPTPDTEQETESATRKVDQSRAQDAPRQLETRAIPSLDPERTSTGSQSNDQPRRDAPGRAESQRSTGDRAVQQGTAQGSTAGQQSGTQQRQQSGTGQQATESTDTSAAEATAAASGAAQSQQATAEAEAASDDADEDGEAATERIEELQDLLEERESEIQRLESELESAESERESLRRELEQVREERDELQADVESLESELQRLEDELGAATNAQQRMTPQEALSGTDIFVRYRSKGDATLEKAHGGSGFQEDVVENLRLEKHTQFDAETVAVGGREYDEFLEDTVAYRFVRWVVEELLFEIQSTGHTEALQDLYDSLPQINRIELNGSVNVTYTEDGQETETTESFDVVFRERMGDPLLVANINDSREGATESMMEGLITSAERVGQTTDQFASAFLVTESFFEPEALETVAEATRGGLLSRDKRKSFVNLSRKRGYHLCLVEARNQNFHLEVPEL